jgi:repressor LexA
MENKFTKIKYRVLQIAEHYRINKENFFKRIGMTSANFRGNAKETPLNSNAIENIIANYPEINLQWLLTGEGEMPFGLFLDYPK